MRTLQDEMNEVFDWMVEKGGPLGLQIADSLLALVKAYAKAVGWKP